MSKKNIILIAALILVVLIGGAVALTGGRKDTPNNAKENTATNSQNDADAALLGETFTDTKAGVTMKIPKGWQLTPKNDDNPGSLTKFVLTPNASGTARANGELIARRTNASMDDIVRGYLEAAMDINATPNLVANQNVRLGDKAVRLLVQELPGPNGATGRITQYIMYKDGTYYIVAFTMLSADWEAQRPGIEAAIKSLQFTAQ